MNYLSKSSGYRATMYSYSYDNLENSDDADDLKQLPPSAHCPPSLVGLMLRPPRATVGNEETGVKLALNELVSSLKDIAPAMKTIASESEARQTILSQQAAQNAVTTAFIQAQVQAMTQLNDELVDHEKRLSQQQKRVDDHEERLKKVEALLERNNDHFPLPDGEASAPAPTLIPIQVPAPLPMPVSMPAPPPLAIQAPVLMPAPAPIANSAPRASGACEPPGWSKLNVQAREYLSRVASARLQLNANAFRDALGTLTPHAALSCFCLPLR